jgi:hypothetical protein
LHLNTFVFVGLLLDYERPFEIKSLQALKILIYGTMASSEDITETMTNPLILLLYSLSHYLRHWWSYHACIINTGAFLMVQRVSMLCLGSYRRNNRRHVTDARPSTSAWCRDFCSSPSRGTHLATTSSPPLHSLIRRQFANWRFVNKRISLLLLFWETEEFAIAVKVL